MSAFWLIMHRYTTLVWDSNKKTLLGKNGVSWLSIVLGSLVVIICIGIFIRCIIDVKESRQQSEAQLRKLLLQKKQLFLAQSETMTARNGSNTTRGIILSELTSKEMSYELPGLSINRSVIVLKGSAIFGKKIEEQYGKDASFFLRNKRQVSAAKTAALLTNSENSSSESIYGFEKETELIMFSTNNKSQVRFDNFNLTAVENCNTMGTEKFVKRSNMDNCKEIIGMNASSTISPDDIERKHKRHNPNSIANILNRFVQAAGLNKLKLPPNGVFNKTGSATTPTTAGLNMVEKSENLKPKKRSSIANTFNTFATLKLERLKKRPTIVSTLDEVLHKQKAEKYKKLINEKDLVSSNKGENLKNVAETTNPTRFETNTVFDKIAEARFERLKRNSTISSVLTKVLNKTTQDKNEEYNPRDEIPEADDSENIGAEIIEKKSAGNFVTTGKIARLRRGVPINSIVTEVFGKCVREKNEIEQNGPNLVDFVMNLTQGSAPLGRNRRV